MRNFLKKKPGKLTMSVSEVFTSIEGEGPLTGYPMVFIRSFGCNFTCRGFSNPDLVPIAFQDIDDLRHFKPTTGCDSSYSWHPNFKHLSTKYNVDSLWEKIYEKLPKYAQDLMQEHVPESALQPSSFPAFSITGGEPLLHQKFWIDFFSHESSLRYIRKLVIETNASVPIHPRFSSVLRNLEKKGCLVVWANSPKLTNSGEPHEKARKPSVLLQQQQHFKNEIQYVKFVSDGSEASFAEIRSTVNEYNTYLREHGAYTLKDEQVYIMPEGATLQQQEDVQRKVAEGCVQNGYSFCARVHVWVFGNETGT